MFKKLIPLLSFTFLANAAFATEPRPANPAPAPAAAATTTEIRYVSAPSNRKGSKVSKLIITRDANGKIISVKRG
jgi:hypothetical protein